MRFSSSQHRLKLPDSLRAQLVAFRGRLWRIKLIESACGAVSGVLAAFLAVFALDRAFDTPAWARFVALGAAVAAGMLLPISLYRWVWRRRRLDQLARLLTRRHPGIGDQLLGVVELVHSESEQARSPALCEAAMQQVAEAARGRDFSDAVPSPRDRRLAVVASLAACAAAALLAYVPGASTNPRRGALEPARWRSGANSPSRRSFAMARIASMSRRRSTPAGSTCGSATCGSRSASSRRCGRS